MLNPKLNLSPQIFKKDLYQKSCRDGFGEALVEVGEADERIVVLTADLKDSTRVTAFKERFPDRFFEVGVAEQALVTIASGMAAYGKIPFVTSFAIFSPGRNWEQIRTTICLNDVPVKIIGAYTYFGNGFDGATHQCLEDLALMRTLPNLVTLAPADYEQTKKAVSAAAFNDQPTYLRLPRMSSPAFTTPDTPFEIGKSQVLFESKDPQVTLVACGPLVYEALLAAKKLAQSKIGSIVINLHTVKPIDQQALIRAAKTTACLVTIEDHQVNGGLGGAVSEVLAKNYPVIIEMVGVEDTFGESGKPQELLKKYGLTAVSIVSAAKRAIRRKST